MKPIFVFLCIIALNTAETFRESKKVFSNSGSSHLSKIFRSRRKLRRQSEDEPSASPSREYFAQPSNSFSSYPRSQSLSSDSSSLTASSSSSQTSSLTGSFQAFPDRIRYSKLADPSSNPKPSPKTVLSAAQAKSNSRRLQSTSSGGSRHSGYGSNSRSRYDSTSRNGYGSASTSQHDSSYGEYQPSSSGSVPSSSGYQTYQGYGQNVQGGGNTGTGYPMSYSGQMYGQYQGRNSPYSYEQNRYGGSSTSGSNQRGRGGYYGRTYPQQQSGSNGYSNLYPQQSGSYGNRQVYGQRPYQGTSSSHSYGNPNPSSSSYGYGNPSSSMSSSSYGNNNYGQSLLPSSSATSEGQDIRIGSSSTRYGGGDGNSGGGRATLGSLQTDNIYTGHLGARTPYNPYSSQNSRYYSGNPYGSSHSQSSNSAFRYRQNSYSDTASSYGGSYGFRSGSGGYDRGDSSNGQAYGNTQAYGSEQPNSGGAYQLSLSHSPSYGRTSTGIGTSDSQTSGLGTSRFGSSYSSSRPYGGAYATVSSYGRRSDRGRQ